MAPSFYPRYGRCTSVVGRLSVVARMARLHTDGMADDLAPPSANTFDEVVLPHLEAGRRLARWIMGNHDDADDVVQEASLRAFRYFRTFTGGDSRAWFLTIVRNVCWSSFRRLDTLTDPF